MVKKTKGGRVMNPTDAERKKARQKEINRNKLERTMQRSTPKDDPEKIKAMLAVLIQQEEAEKAKGRTINQELRLRRKVLQDAMKVAVVKEKEIRLKAEFEGKAIKTTAYGHGVPERKPEDSVYFDPVHNPTGQPPPGKPQRYKDDVDILDASRAIENLPVPPKAPPLPQGPAPLPPGRPPGEALPLQPLAGVMPPPAHPPPLADLPPGTTDLLPPPDGPPPGILPLPAGPPPGILPPPTTPPPGALTSPGFLPPLPLGAPQAFNDAGAASLVVKRPAQAVVEGAATAQRTIPAQQDARLMAMVPASVRVKRQRVADKPRLVPVRQINKDAGFGLAPQIEPSRVAETLDSTLESFMAEINGL